MQVYLTYLGPAQSAVQALDIVIQTNYLCYTKSLFPQDMCAWVLDMTSGVVWIM